MTIQIGNGTAIEITAEKTNEKIETKDAVKTAAPVPEPTRIETDNELKADPAHPAPVQGSDSGRAQGEAPGETRKAETEK
jgi:hypothetical protein